MNGFTSSLRLAALIAGIGGALAVTAPAQARDSFSFGYSDGRSGLNVGVNDGRGRYVDEHRGRDWRWDRRARRYVPPPYYYYPPPRYFAPPPPDWYAPPPPPPRYYDYRY